MPSVTNFSCIDENGFPVLCDAFLTYVAFRCSGCGAPVLSVIRKYHRGAGMKNPSVCPSCGGRFWIEAKYELRQLVVHRVS